ncbi:MAG: response regulator [Campylobacterales bacterium]
MQKPVILYVEDEESERASVARLVGARVGTVVAAADAQEALRLFEAQRPDLVLSDICLPGEDGLSLVRSLRAIDPNVPVVLISAYSGSEYLFEAIRIGVRDFLTKPVEIGKLVATLERCLEEAHLSREYERLRFYNIKPEELDVMARLYRYFRPLADAAPLLIRVSDEAGEASFFNQRWNGFTGLEEPALRGQGWIEALHPDDRAAYLKRLDWAYKNRVPLDVEFRLRRSDGEYRWMLEHHTPRLNGDRFEGFVSSCVDISDVQQTKAAQEANGRYRALFETMLNGFALHEAVLDEAGNMVDYRFLQVNPAFERMVQKSAQELVGKTVLEVFPRTESYWIEQYARVAVGGERLEFEEYSRALDKYFVVSAFRPAPGQFAVMAQDVTDRRRAQMDLEQINRELEARIDREVQKRRESELALLRQARVSMMGEMLSALAHHWRQPLSAVSLYIQGIAEAFHSGELKAEYLDRAVERAMELIMQMSKTIDEVRGFAAERPRLTRCCALEEVKQVFALAAPELQMLGIGVTARCFGEGPKPLEACLCAPHSAGWSRLYPAEFRQVVFNLIANARDAILLRRANTGSGFAGMIVVGFELTEGWEIITLEDNGGGIDRAAMEHLFEPFFTTKERAQGSGVISGVGLGLYLSKMVIEEQMKGRLRAENTARGAKVVIELPLVG